ncbi:MAG TPA: NlpC/P60 family protein [Verrucomicrobiae bacterium]|nr:NlpC/P60 family protein [Verrucomicrobiae bacterium]
MRKLWFRLWIALWPIAIVLFLYPINDRPLRIGLILSLLGLWIGCLYLGWHQRPVRFGLLLCSVITAGFLTGPGRNYEIEKLRNTYVASLRSFEGTRYIWGGENKQGIDCSGLVRAGLIKASGEQGLETLNPGLVRYSLSLWWHDSTAKALGEEYRHQTKHVLKAASINSLDQDKVLPGDIAVTANGVHVLACLGNSEWIEADPLLGKVIVVKLPSAKNPWFNEPVNVLRWTSLEEK